MPSCRIFLDVDDLVHISQLETYVQQTQSMLFFVSDGYFSSRNCLREIDAAVEQGKPIVLVCDRMYDAPNVLDRRRNDCPDRLRKPVFGDPSNPCNVIPWIRLPEFQRESLRLIAMQMLAETPKMRGLAVTELHMANEIRLQKLQFDRPLTLIVSPNNLGAVAAAHEFAERFSNVKVSMLSSSLAPSRRPRRRVSGRVNALRKVPVRKTSMNKSSSTTTADSPAEGVFFLYLNRQVFSGEVCSSRADTSKGYLSRSESNVSSRSAEPPPLEFGLFEAELHQLLDEAASIVMVHENDPERGGCPFSYFFQVCA